MANSEFEYTRKFEQWDALPLSNWIIVRIDGRSFSKLCKKYHFRKANDARALDLMNAAALETVRAIVDICIAYGQSDEYSFVLQESTTLFDRRASKLASTIAATFTAEYCMQWSTFFPDQPLTRPFPTFDGRCVCYPKRRVLRDYLSWRQADCHINNLYNTTFWKMVLDGGMTTTAAEDELKSTLAVNKNEILFKRFGVNYNNEPAMFRKGTVVYRSYGNYVGGDAVYARGLSESDSNPNGQSKTQLEKERKKKQKATIITEHVDIIGDAFWKQHPYILATRRNANDDDE